LIWAVASALIVAGVVLIVMGLHGPREGPNLPGPIGNTSLGVTGRPTFADAPSGSSPVVVLDSYRSSAPVAARSDSAPLKNAHVATVKRSTPVHLSIPAIGVSVKLSEVGLKSNGSVQVPTSYHVPGWYKDGPAPGQIGSAVILGHVDSVAGAGVFYRLNDLRVGDRVTVTLKDSTKVTFKVIGLREYEKNTFPERLVYGPRSYSALQLVTCGGIFDSKTGHYLSNIVVFTKMIKS
jgi:sortase (surface protein transpeptidase)